MQQNKAEASNADDGSLQLAQSLARLLSNARRAPPFHCSRQQQQRSVKKDGFKSLPGNEEPPTPAGCIHNPVAAPLQDA
jgi:hypothetical protein